jgi:membrane-bound serine protease (ClpP class)
MVRFDLFILFCLACLLPLQSVVAEEAAQPAYRQPVLIRVEGVIGSRLEHYVLRKLARAKAVGCDLLILEIDSPGGGLAETLKLCGEIEKLHGVHTVAFVPREALSGAAILSLACDEIIMNETARIGDCGPIFMAEDFLFRHAPEKIRSDLVAQVRLLAEQNGHPPALAEAMVDFTVKVERYRLPDGSEQFFTSRELQGRPGPPPGERLETLAESGDGRFLELSGKRVKELGLASANIDRRDKLTEYFHLESPPLVLKPNAVDTTVFWLNHWLVTGLLLVVGLVALMYELSAPGVGIGGLTAGLCFVLFFWSRFLGGTSGWLEVVLFAAGVVFLAMELFVIPGFGITGITGICLMLAGIVLASQEFALPTNNAELGITVSSTLTALISGMVCVAICALMVRHMGSIPVLNRLMLKPPQPAMETVTAHGKEKTPLLDTETIVAVGDWGTAATLLRPGGKGQFGDRVVDVVSDSGFLQPGTQIRVIDMRGSRIVVEQAEA